MPKAGKKKAPEDKPLLDVQEAIQRKMHWRKTDREFICKYDLDQIWADHSLRQIFPQFTPEEQESIRKDYMRVLSILIYIDWNGLSRFRPLFLREKGRDDAHLPFTDLAFLAGSKDLFSFHQHAFKPVVIEEHNERHIQDISKEHRLPFTEEPELVGNGGYGSVTKRVIAPRCLRNKVENKDNPEPKDVACKVYRNEYPIQDFRKEVANLDYIKEGLTDSKRVMKHIAAIVYGNEFMIILPLANLNNLEIFLRCGHEPRPGTDAALKQIYDFDDKFPKLRTSLELQQAVVREAHQLASALKWLHEDLKIFGSSDRYLAHMDLKPENILLVGDPLSPAGKWMLSDFGVSSFYKASNARVPDTPSIRDVGLRLTSRGHQDKIVRGHGSYQPPEVDLENVDSRKCDVWSFSCVLCDILAFAIGKSEAVNALRELRYVRGDDYFYERTAPTGKTIKTIDDSNTKLKSQIVQYWDDLERSSARWVINYIKVLRKALKSKPSDRPGIRDIVQGLDDLAPSISPQASEALGPNPQIASSSHQTDGLAPLHTLEAPEMRPSITFTHPSSPRHHERRDSQDAASTGVDHGQSSSDLLSPRAASYRERHLPAGHKETSSESSSSSTTLTDATKDIPHMPAWRSPPLPDEPSPERHNASFSIPAYREATKLSVSLPKKAKVKAVAITPSALQFAVLCKDSVHLYSTGDGKEMGRPIDLSPKVDWTKIRLAAHYFAVYGLGPSREKLIEIYELYTTSHEAIVASQGELVQDILLSDEDVFAYVYGRYVHVRFVRRKSVRKVSMTEDDDAFIIQAKFSASGKFLCVWATGTRADHVYFVSVNEEQARAFLCGQGSYQKTDTNYPPSDIWPCPDSPACIIHEAHGGTFLAQALDEPQLEPQQRNSIWIPNALTACVVREDLLVCLQSKAFNKRLLCGFQLSQEPRGQRRITGPRQDLRAANKDIEKSTATAARLVDGKSQLVLCTITGKVLRYVQS